MAVPRVLILKAAGINCDQETAFAFEAAGGRSELVHINQLVRGEKKLADYQILAISGGFTYGDDVAAGKILANELRYKLFEQIRSFIDGGKLIIGICNGFQVLIKSGILPGLACVRQEATLFTNDSGRFEDRWVYLRKPAEGPSPCVWTRGIRRLPYFPVAHGEGKFIPRSEEVLEVLKRQGQVVFQYCDAKGREGDYPVNPNGSIDAIAGICDPTGRVFGLMPHPERHLISLQHPRWTREGLKKHGDGFAIFLNAVNFFRKDGTK